MADEKMSTTEEPAEEVEKGRRDDVVVVAAKEEETSGGVNPPAQLPQIMSKTETMKREVVVEEEEVKDGRQEDEVVVVAAVKEEAGVHPPLSPQQAPPPCGSNSRIRMSERSGPKAKRLKRVEEEEKEEKEEKGVEQQEFKNDKDDDDDDDSISSTESTTQKAGAYSWKGDNQGNNNDDNDDDNNNENVVVPWNGCVCGQIHERPIPVFWIGCDGPCQAWYNVRSSCVNGLTCEEAKLLRDWYCPTCSKQLTQGQGKGEGSNFVCNLIELPMDVLYKMLEFTAPPTYRYSVIVHQLAPLNKSTYHYFITRGGDKSKQLWETILQREYLMNNKSSEQQQSAVASASAAASAPPPPSTPPARRRSSQRQRKKTNFLSPCPQLMARHNHPRHQVKQQHRALLQRTEDAYYILEELADPYNANTRKNPHAAVNKTKKSSSTSSSTTLTLNRLKQILAEYSPLDVNRPSPSTGRTLLQVIIAGEMAENTIVGCVRHLLQPPYNANPNIFSLHEQPYANRPAIYFAIARAMPNLVQTLIEHDDNASSSSSLLLRVAVEGRWKMTFDTTREIVGGPYTPLEYAKLMKQIEVIETRRGRRGGDGSGSSAPGHSAVNVPSPYWINKLNIMIRKLQDATEYQKRREDELIRLRQIQNAQNTSRAKRAASRQQQKGGTGGVIRNKNGKPIGRIGMMNL